MFSKKRIPWNKGKTFLAGEKNPMFGVHRFGKNAPHYGKKHTLEFKRTMSKKAKERYILFGSPTKGLKRPDLVERNKRNLGKTYIELFGDRAGSILKNVRNSLPRLEKHHNWRGGLSFEPYSRSWTDELRQKIKERDNFTCNICNQSQLVLNVHHIDYNKQNSNEENLITLCRSCHTRTNYNRGIWELFFIMRRINKIRPNLFVNINCLFDEWSYEGILINKGIVFNKMEKKE